jgi:putative ATPase
VTDLFGASSLSEQAPRPLADFLRPNQLADVVGQDHLLSQTGAIGRMLAQKRLSSMILWGPPGVGKTTIARLLADEAGLAFTSVSAVFSGVADLRKAFEAATQLRATGKGTLLFVDEIHRFNRAQQDGFLPFVEAGTVTLVGATTENPSFEVNGALLSRARVFVLKALDDSALMALLARAEAHYQRPAPLTSDARDVLIDFADGDGRHFLTLVEEVFASAPEHLLDGGALAAFLQRRAPHYDKNKEEHYNLISALHKSVRASDPDASLYWLARMLQGGEDPLFLARRLVRMASEDIGLADPTALRVCIAARDAYQFLGAPEGELALAQATLHLACAPKSNATYVAFKKAQKLAQETASLGPPARFRNAPTGLMRELGYGAGYQYDPDVAGGVSGQSGFPDELSPQDLYAPTDNGAEARIVDKLQTWRELRRASSPKWA